MGYFGAVLCGSVWFGDLTDPCFEMWAKLGLGSECLKEEH